MAISMTEKASRYKRVAQDAIDYIRLCADKHIVPLQWDAEKMQSDLEHIRGEQVRP